MVAGGLWPNPSHSETQAQLWEDEDTNTDGITTWDEEQKKKNEFVQKIFFLICWYQKTTFCNKYKYCIGIL